MSNSRRPPRPPGSLPSSQSSEEHNRQNEDPDFPNPHFNLGNQRFYRRYQAYVSRDPEPRSPYPQDLSRFRLPAPPPPPPPQPTESDESDSDNLSLALLKEQLLALARDPQRGQHSENEGPRPPLGRRDNMIAPNPLGVPYTISSGEWSLASNSSKNSQGLEDIPEEQLSARRTSVISVYSTVYAVAKIVFTIFADYGVEVSQAMSKKTHFRSQ